MVARGYFGRFCFCGADFFIFLINRRPAFGIFDKETGNMRQNSLKKKRHNAALGRIKLLKKLIISESFAKF